MLKTHHWLSLTASASWVLAGMVIAGSIYYNPQSYLINLTVALVMLLIGGLLYFRAGSLKKLGLRIAGNKDDKMEPDLSLLMQKHLKWDLLLVLLSLFAGSILAYMALYRVFSENLAVFG